MVRLKSYVCGAWHEGEAPFRPLVDPSTEEVIAETSARGIDFGAVMEHAHTGGEALRAMTFAERGALLKAMSKALFSRREELIAVAIANGGNTRGDAKFDIDGATATLAFYAGLGKSLGDGTFLVDGESDQLLPTSGRFFGKHLRVPRRGVAVHINAFNFPAWGTFEKAACSLLAGVPIITKPATSTAWLTYEMVKILVDEGVMPEGSLQLVCGSTGDLLSRLGGQDVLAFTGSATTGAKLRAGDFHVQRSAHVNVEADSLNASVIGPDVDRGSDTWNWFVRSVSKEMTQKAGQKCTAIRRIFVPVDRLDEAQADLSEELSGAGVGDPSLRQVRVGPLATASQLRDIRAGIDRLCEVATVVHGDGGRGALEGIEGEAGFFVSPTLLRVEDGHEATIVHEHEVFGPVSTLIPYDGTAADAAALVCLGEGGLVASIYSDSQRFISEALFGIAPYNGRIHIGGRKVADHSPGPGTVMPQMQHGGPGRAGGGQELGGHRGLDFYTQRVAVQGLSPLLEKLFKDGVNA